jgi:dTDP-4-amino-4,6-dideoxygalactose transaminase
MIKYEDLNKLNKKFFSVFLSYLKNNNNFNYILGKNLKNFENEFAKFIGAKYCVGVGNGFDAIKISLDSLELNKGDEVIVPANTYLGTILPIIKSGLKPVLVEPNLQTYNIDEEKIEGAITKRTKVILIVHLYGRPCRMDKIHYLCKKYKLFLIEDCAQSHGAKHKSKTTGTFGDFGCFSFYPTKNLGAIGDAGSVLTSNRDSYERLLRLRNYGGTKRFYSDILGYNSRLDDLQAIFLNIKLRYLRKINKHKQKLAAHYDKHLNNKFIILPLKEIENENVYYVYNIRTKKRDELKNYLKKKNIQTDIHYPIPPHKQKSLKNFFEKKYPITEEIHKTTLSLPISFIHTLKDVEYVSNEVNNFFKKK